MNERRVIRMFVDAAEWPHWEDGTVRYPGAPSDYALTAALTGELRGWQDEWDRDFDLNAEPPRWRPGRGVGWAERGEQIADRLQREVGAFADVEYDGRPY